jgi:hypothetical protein
MADLKISALTGASTPLAGTEVLPIVQSGSTVKVSVANLTAGRALSATELTLTTGNLIVSNGKGVDFSLTPGTGTSELLADYEEGTWTATLKGSVSDPTTPVTTTARYTRIGDTVHIWCAFANVDTTGASGNVTVIGIPFTSGSFKAQGPVWLGNFTIANKYVVAYLGASSSTVNFEDVAGAGFGANLQQSAGAARYLEFTLTYKV